MDQKGDYIIETAKDTHNYYVRKIVQFVVPISIISFLVYYFSGFPLFFHDLDQFPTLTFPFVGDRKCMFLICNGILAFLAMNSLKLTASSSGLNYGGFMKISTDEDDMKQIPPEISVVEENAASMEYVDTPLDDVAFPQEKDVPSLEQEEEYCSSQKKEAEEKKADEAVILDSTEDWEEEDEEESGSVEDSLVKEEVNDMRVSTEELNKKFEEFIRRMKQEIRIEARQQYMIAV